MNSGLCLRWLSARSTAPLPRMGSELAVDDTTMSTCARWDGISASGIARQSTACARLWARSTERLAISMRVTPRALRWRATSSMLSPAPMSSARCSLRRANTRSARPTPVVATETECAPMAV